MKTYLKKLNWGGAFLIQCLCTLAGAMRTQDPNLGVSLLFGACVGFPFAVLFLFAGKQK